MSVDGVVAAEVSFERAEAVVQIDESRVGPDRLVQAVNDAGFKASIRGHGPAAASDRLKEEP